MKRTIPAVILTLTVVAFVAGSVVLAQDDDSKLQPKMYIAKTHHDFGKTFEQETYEFDFVIRNQGKADLVIEKVKPG